MVFGASRFGDHRRQAARRKKDSGAEKERAAGGMTGRDAVPPSSGVFYGGRWSREGISISELPSDGGSVFFCGSNLLYSYATK